MSASTAATTDATSIAPCIARDCGAVAGRRTGIAQRPPGTSRRTAPSGSRHRERIDRDRASRHLREEFARAADHRRAGPNSVTVGTPAIGRDAPMPVSGGAEECARLSTCHSCASDSGTVDAAPAPAAARSRRGSPARPTRSRRACRARSAHVGQYRQRSANHSFSTELTPTCSHRVLDR